jgi:hypothetical protein
LAAAPYELSIARPRRAVAAVAAAAACAAALAACGGTDRDAGERASGAAPPPALPARAIPYLDSRANTLSPAALARESGQPVLRARLAQWGFDGGTRRYFQGESRRLQVVDSRALRFRDAAGAAAFVGFVRTHPGSFLGGAVSPRPFSSRGRQGIVLRAAPCACHLATPALLAVLSRGRLVTWLEINGPRATVGALAALAAKAP